ncbi:hypothetical protein GDO78_009414 [Eleutherodactylus coqui]|uniref:Uncharacterized protein n=1 Tax=Eleutherodactylus coqui TaxID=57060 RepID=A0A8J6KCA4_ELECQ|nr:hypothetical protein GDO78_009414 [Eleutherodactylus coqui]
MVQSLSLRHPSMSTLNYSKSGISKTGQNHCVFKLEGLNMELCPNKKGEKCLTTRTTFALIETSPWTCTFCSNPFKLIWFLDF